MAPVEGATAPTNRRRNYIFSVSNQRRINDKEMLKIRFPDFVQIFPDLSPISHNFFQISTIKILREGA